MTKTISLTLGLLLLSGIAIAAPSDKDWSAGGRWLTPYSMPGYTGYGFTLPSDDQMAARPR